MFLIFLELIERGGGSCHWIHPFNSSGDDTKKSKLSVMLLLRFILFHFRNILVVSRMHVCGWDNAPATFFVCASAPTPYIRQRQLREFPSSAQAGNILCITHQLPLSFSLNTHRMNLAFSILSPASTHLLVSFDTKSMFVFHSFILMNQSVWIHGRLWL